MDRQTDAVWHMRTCLIFATDMTLEEVQLEKKMILESESVLDVDAKEIE